MAKYLVTGGAGFIGSHIVERLVNDGQPVRVIDNFVTGKRSNIAPFGSKVDVFEGDLRSAEDCRKACKDIETIFHLGALPSVPKSVAAPVPAHETNVDGTFNLLMAARDAKCRRLIFAASSSAYGDAVELPKRETASPQPLSPYAVHKLLGEYYCRVFSLCYGLETIALRYFNVFGPRQDPKSDYAAAIPAFISAVLRNEPPTVYGDGEQTRDFTYIDNVVHANMLAAKAPRLNGQVVNIACGERVSVNQIIREINNLLGRNLVPKYAPERAGDVKHSLADITAAYQLLGFEPQVNFADGLRLAIDWYKANL
jgi:nucleoside-diphosphate-sugar epimerase